MTANLQNQHILKTLGDAQSAAKHLISKGLTVTHISIEGAHPRIDLLTPPGRKESLPVSWKIIRQSAKGKEIEMAACVKGCEIHWKEQA